jgi:hypothetical protein
MKIKIYLFLLAIIFSFNTLLSHGDKSTGLGIALGDPTGPVLKYWLNKKNAIDLGIGFQKNIVIYGGYLWHSWKIFPRIEKGILGGYIGLGGRFGERDAFRYTLRVWS